MSRKCPLAHIRVIGRFLKLPTSSCWPIEACRYWILWEWRQLCRDGLWWARNPRTAIRDTLNSPPTKDWSITPLRHDTPPTMRSNLFPRIQMRDQPMSLNIASSPLFVSLIAKDLWGPPSAFYSSSYSQNRNRSSQSISPTMWSARFTATSIFLHSRSSSSIFHPSSM